VDYHGVSYRVVPHNVTLQRMDGHRALIRAFALRCREIPHGRLVWVGELYASVSSHMTGTEGRMSLHPGSFTVSCEITFLTIQGANRAPSGWEFALDATPGAIPIR